MAGDFDGADVCEVMKPMTDAAASAPPAIRLTIGPTKVAFMCNDPP